jgi:hypothetical protein
VLDSVQCALHEAGFMVKRMDLGVSENGHKFFGVIDLASTIIEGVSLAVGVRNSTDKSLPAGIAAGERVLVCDNLAFAATIVIMRKHTRRILDELDDRIISGISKLAAFQQASAGRIRHYSNCWRPAAAARCGTGRRAASAQCHMNGPGLARCTRPPRDAQRLRRAGIRPKPGPFRLLPQGPPKGPRDTRTWTQL